MDESLEAIELDWIELNWIRTVLRLVSCVQSECLLLSL